MLQWGLSVRYVCSIIIEQLVLGPERPCQAMRALKHPPTTDIELTRVLHALSDPVRLEVVQRLARQGTASCSDLDMGRPKSTMTHHFRILREAGVIRTTLQGAAHINTLRRAELDRLFPGLLAAILGERGDSP